jgi:hypothetical protein
MLAYVVISAYAQTSPFLPDDEASGKRQLS